MKGDAIILQSRSDNAVHLSLYKTLGNKTALCKYLSWSVVSRFLLSLLANNWYSVLHCFLTNFLLRESVNQTPKNLNETSGARGVLWKSMLWARNLCEVGTSGKGDEQLCESLLQMRTALLKLIFVLLNE